MSKKQKIRNSIEQATEIILDRNGIIRTSEAIKAGIHPRTLYQMRDRGILEKLSRGLYHLMDIEAVSNPDIAVIASRVPNSVICLISALSFHGITTQIPHEISIAILKDKKAPVIDYPPIKVYKFSSSAFSAGIEEHRIDALTVKIYNPEKTLADCFKFRNKIGMDVVLEALKLYRNNMKFNHKKILEYARICRVDKIILPYLEANI